MFALSLQSITRLRVVILAVSAVIASHPRAATAAEVCTDRILEAEQRYHIPTGLLLAVSLVESGQNGAPQAFAMNVAGRSLVADSAADAARHLHDQRGHLIAGVMAGCMQLSVSDHRAAFTPLEKIVEPNSNVDYGARLLHRLYEDQGSWSAAVIAYNGGSQRRQYLCRVWRALAHLDNANAEVLDGSGCTEGQTVAIAPATRKAYETTREAVASLPPENFDDAP